MVQPHGDQLNEDEKAVRETIFKQVRGSYVNDKFDLANLIRTNATFSDATAVTDKIGGLIEEGRNDGSGRQDGSQMGGRLGVCICISSKTVICN